MASENSTNGRSLARTALGVLFRTSAAFSRDLAAELATRAFFRPERAKPSARSLEVLRSATEIDVRVGPDSVKAWTWGSGPAVFLVHGWSGRASQLGSFVEPLVAAGYSVTAFDAPGHGASTGTLSSLLHFSRALRALSRGRELHAVIAHSLGGAAAAHALAHGLEARNVVFVGTPAHVGVYFHRFLGALGADAGLVEAISRRLEHRLGFGWKELDVAGLASAREERLLVVHDAADAEVSWNEGALVARLWPGAELVTTHGLGHRKILRDSSVVRQIVGFLGGARAEHPSPRCANHGCPDSAYVREAGRLCARCELEQHLFDREARWAA